MHADRNTALGTDLPSAPSGDRSHVVPRTRLAPSPTGALHLGNARTFLINWALAKQRGWRILLRIEDLDTPRVKPDAIGGVLRTLEALGMDWDEGPEIQSRDLGPYREAMQTLAGAGAVYPSRESRSLVEEAASNAASAPQEGVQEAAFPASLRPAEFPHMFSEVGEPVNWRFVTPDVEIAFEDGFAGGQTHRVSKTVGDFVVWTKRSQPAYQLAVVVDDARRKITHIVRGDDLLDSAARQMLLMRALRVESIPEYFHLPLVRGTDGKRLAKRHGDTRVDSYLAKKIPAERIIALLARWSGIEGGAGGMSAGEFAAAFDLSRLSRRDVVFTDQDDRWLLEGRVNK